MGDHSRGAATARTGQPSVIFADLDSCLSGDAILSALYAYWRSKQAAGRLPTRADIAPAEIPRLLPHVGLIDVLDAGGGFRYRLIGSHMVDVFGHDFTGTTLGEPHKDGDYGRFLHGLYSEAVARRGAIYCESRFLYRDDEDMLIRRLLLPLAGAEGGVAMLLFANSFDWSAADRYTTSGSFDVVRSFSSQDIRQIIPLRRVCDTATANPAG